MGDISVLKYLKCLFKQQVAKSYKFRAKRCVDIPTISCSVFFFFFRCTIVLVKLRQTVVNTAEFRHVIRNR